MTLVPSGGGLVILNARVLTLAGNAERRGHATGELGVIDPGFVLVEGSRVARVAPMSEWPPTPRGLGRAPRVIDARGRVVMPAFVDCHTHACWVGQRLDEWEMRLAGASYLDILARGGGIMRTVRGVREASLELLQNVLLERLESMLRQGTTLAEVKSGYGLSTRDEIKMLRAIHGAAERWAGTLVPTACIGHAIDAADPAFVDRTIHETLDAVHAEFPRVTIDAYCERGAWTLDDGVRLFERALHLGHPIRVHADQFNSLGMVPWAIAHGAASVDHLEASLPRDLALLGASNTFGVVLPCSGFHVDGRYANARAILDAGGRVALATNCNPGSAPCTSMPMAIALGVRGCGLTPAQAIAGATAQGASLLRRVDPALEPTGTIEVGARADLLMLRWSDERELAHSFGADPVELVISAGRIVG